MTETSSSNADMVTIKDIYLQSVTMHQYFLTWRHRLFAGYIATIAAHAIAYSWVMDKDIEINKELIPASCVIISITLWLMDLRTRVLYHACHDVAQSCERESNLNTSCRLYRKLRTTTSGFLNHSPIMDMFFLAVIKVSLSFQSMETWRPFVLINSANIILIIIVGYVVYNMYEGAKKNTPSLHQLLYL